MRALAPIEDTKAVFQTMSPYAITRMTFLLHTLFPSVTHNTAEEYDVLLEWALA